jgi:hypothetical protein
MLGTEPQCKSKPLHCFQIGRSFQSKVAAGVAMAMAMAIGMARVKAVRMGIPRVRVRTMVITVVTAITIAAAMTMEMAMAMATAMARTVAMAMTAEMATKMTTSIRTRNAERWDFMGGDSINERDTLKTNLEVVLRSPVAFLLTIEHKGDPQYLRQ